MPWHRRHELLPFGYRFTVFLWWTTSVGAAVITLALFGVKFYEWITWTRVPIAPQTRALQIFCPALFIVFAVLMELGWLSGTTISTDRRRRGLQARDPSSVRKSWAPGRPRP